MKSQDTGCALVGQNVTWSGGFPTARSPCFHYGRPIKFNTAIYSLRAFFEKTTVVILMTQNKGWNHFQNTCNTSGHNSLSRETTMTLTWLIPLDISFAFFFGSMSDFLEACRSLAFNFYVRWYKTSANGRRPFVSTST